MGRHRRGVVIAASLALALIAVNPASAGMGQQVANPQSPEVTGSPAEIGQWTQPFEEGGAETPRCHRKDGLLKDEIFCKPAANTLALLPDGRAYYTNGIEADENVRYHYELELGNRTRADRTRVLDLRGDEPKWTTPPQEAGASWNPNVKPGQNWMNGDPFGVLGFPGRPGDGFWGSKWGKLGGPPQQPSSPPDDKPYSERGTFCADIAQLADGRVLMVGGTDYYNEPSLADRDEGAPADVGLLELEGLRASWIFDPQTDLHHATGAMKYGRWYPTVVTMPDGKMTVFSGVTKLLKSTQMGQVRRTETYDPATGTWTENYVGDESETALPLFSRLTLLPNGKILFNGVGQNFGPNGTDFEEVTFNFQKIYDPATKKWTMGELVGSRGSAAQVLLPLKAPYDEGQVLVSGGTFGIPPGFPLATNLSTMTTVKGNSITHRMTKGQLNNRRWFHDGTILPDGTILATNGGDKDSLQMPGYEIAVRQAEIFDPATDMWRPVASANRDRHYHETATLLPDGRVLSGGMVERGHHVRSPPRPEVRLFRQQREGLELRDLQPAVSVPRRPAGDRVRSFRRGLGVELRHHHEGHGRDRQHRPDPDRLSAARPRHRHPLGCARVQAGRQQVDGHCAPDRRRRSARLLHALRQQEVAEGPDPVGRRHGPRR